MAPSTDLPRTDLSRMESQAKSRRGTPKAAPTVVATLEAAPKRAKPLIRQYDLVERVRKYNPHTDEDLLNRAYVYAMKAHGEQKRLSGDPYISHPLEVAAILERIGDLQVLVFDIDLGAGEGGKLRRRQHRGAQDCSGELAPRGLDIGKL